MIITRTPFRISFFGGGTDYPGWYQENGGAVLATTVDKYCYISCRYLPPFFEHKTRVAWSQTEHVKSHDEIIHPAVRATLKFLGIEDGLEIHHDGDLPARTGLGSSSAFTVGFLHALHALKRRMPTKKQLALEAVEIERNLLQESGGVQDQVVTAFGGLNRVSFSPNGEFSVDPLILDQNRLNELQNHLILCFTGLSRSSSEIAREQSKNIFRKGRELSRMFEMVEEAASILKGRSDLGEFGKLLDESWRIKRDLSDKISSLRVNQVYETALEAGALGGKLLGAGGGGFMLLFAPPEAHPRIKERLGGLLSVPFRFENRGTQVIFYEPDSHDRDGEFYKVPTDALEDSARREALGLPPSPAR